MEKIILNSPTFINYPLNSYSNYSLYYSMEKDPTARTPLKLWLHDYPQHTYLIIIIK